MERIKYFDIAKFLGMIFIILGHFGVPDINTFVYTFHVPLFFLISGYFFKPRENKKEFICQKFRQLIIPYLIVMFMVILIKLAVDIYSKSSINLILSNIYINIFSFLYGSGYIENFLGYRIPCISAIWFLLALFWDFIILNSIICHKYKNIILVVLFIIGYFSSQIIWLPLSIQSAMTSVSFMYLGYIAKQKNIFNYSISIGQTLPLLCIWGICLSYGGRFLIVQNYSVFIITDFIAAIAACYLFILYCKWLENNAKSANIMAFLGKYTIVILCFHTIDVLAMPWNSYFKLPNTSSYIICLKLLITLGKFIFPILGAIVVSKNKFLKTLFNIKD